MASNDLQCAKPQPANTETARDVNGVPETTKPEMPCTETPGPTVPNEVILARELLSAATQTFQMAQHIRRLESKIGRLHRKFKRADVPISSNSSSEDNSDSSCEESGSISKHTKRKRRKKYRDKSKRLKEVEKNSEQACSNSDSNTEALEATTPSYCIQIDTDETLEFVCEYCEKRFPHSRRHLLGSHIYNCSRERGLNPPPGGGFRTRLAPIDGELQQSSTTGAPKTPAKLFKSTVDETVINKDEEMSIHESSLPNQEIGPLFVVTPPKRVTQSSPKTMTKSPPKTVSKSSQETVAKLPHKVSVIPLSASQAKTFIDSAQSPRQRRVTTSPLITSNGYLETTCPDCGLTVAKVVRDHHARVCKKQPVCLYCARTFSSLDTLAAHKPACKAANWSEHPVRLLQHERYVPDHCFQRVQVRPALDGGLPATTTIQGPSSTAASGRGIVYHVCMTCDQQFRSVQDLRAHKSQTGLCQRFLEQTARSRRQKQFPCFCQLCGVNFASHSAFSRHRPRCESAHAQVKGVAGTESTVATRKGESSKSAGQYRELESTIHLTELRNLSRTFTNHSVTYTATAPTSTAPTSSAILTEPVAVSEFEDSVTVTSFSTTIATPLVNNGVAERQRTQPKQTDNIDSVQNTLAHNVVHSNDSDSNKNAKEQNVSIRESTTDIKDKHNIEGGLVKHPLNPVMQPFRVRIPTTQSRDLKSLVTSLHDCGALQEALTKLGITQPVRFVSGDQQVMVDPGQSSNRKGKAKEVTKTLNSNPEIIVESSKNTDKECMGFDNPPVGDDGPGMTRDVPRLEAIGVDAQVGATESEPNAYSYQQDKLDKSMCSTSYRASTYNDSKINVGLTLSPHDVQESCRKPIKTYSKLGISKLNEAPKRVSFGSDLTTSLANTTEAEEGFTKIKTKHQQSLTQKDNDTNESHNIRDATMQKSSQSKLFDNDTTLSNTGATSGYIIEQVVDHKKITPESDNAKSHVETSRKQSKHKRISKSEKETTLVIKKAKLCSSLDKQQEILKDEPSNKVSNNRDQLNKPQTTNTVADSSVNRSEATSASSKPGINQRLRPNEKTSQTQRGFKIPKKQRTPFEEELSAMDQRTSSLRLRKRASCSKATESKTAESNKDQPVRVHKGNTKNGNELEPNKTLEDSEQKREHTKDSSSVTKKYGVAKKESATKHDNAFEKTPTKSGNRSKTSTASESRPCIQSSLRRKTELVRVGTSRTRRSTRMPSVDKDCNKKYGKRSDSHHNTKRESGERAHTSGRTEGGTGAPACPRRTITSGGVEMIVSETDDTITCSECRVVMTSIAQIAKHKCYSGSGLFSENVRVNDQAATRTGSKQRSLCNNAGDNSQIETQNHKTTKNNDKVGTEIDSQRHTLSPKTRSYTSRRQANRHTNISVNSHNPSSTPELSYKQKDKHKKTTSKPSSTSKSNQSAPSHTIQKSAKNVSHVAPPSPHLPGTELVSQTSRDTECSQARDQTLMDEVVHVESAELPDGQNVDIVGDGDDL